MNEDKDLDRKVRRGRKRRNSISNKGNRLCAESVKESITHSKGRKELAMAGWKGVRPERTGAKALAVQGQIMKGFMTVLRYLRNPKGTTKPLNSLN